MVDPVVSGNAALRAIEQGKARPNPGPIVTPILPTTALGNRVGGYTIDPYAPPVLPPVRSLFDAPAPPPAVAPSTVVAAGLPPAIAPIDPTASVIGSWRQQILANPTLRQMAETPVAGAMPSGRPLGSAPPVFPYPTETYRQMAETPAAKADYQTMRPLGYQAPPEVLDHVSGGAPLTPKQFEAVNLLHGNTTGLAQPGGGGVRAEEAGGATWLASPHAPFTREQLEALNLRQATGGLAQPGGGMVAEDANAARRETMSHLTKGQAYRLLQLAPKPQSVMDRARDQYLTSLEDEAAGRIAAANRDIKNPELLRTTTEKIKKDYRKDLRGMVVSGMGMFGSDVGGGEEK